MKIDEYTKLLMDEAFRDLKERGIPESELILSFHRALAIKALEVAKTGLIEDSADLPASPTKGVN